MAPVETESLNRQSGNIAAGEHFYCFSNKNPMMDNNRKKALLFPVLGKQ